MEMTSPPPMPPSYQAFEDANHLRMLSIAHYIFAVITGLFSCLALIYVVMGGAMILGFPGMAPSGSTPPTGATPPPDMVWMGWFFSLFGLVFFLLGIALAVCVFLTGKWLAQRKNPTFCFVVACIECINMPLGTLLGIFTILVLNRPSVRALFIAGPQHNNFVRH